MINVTILKKKACFVIAFGARAPPSCSTTSCNDTGLVRSDGQYSNISISLLFVQNACLNGGRRPWKHCWVHNKCNCLCIWVDTAMGPSSIRGSEKSWTCWFGVKCGSETILVYVDTPQDCHSDVLLCAFADEGTKESSIWYSRALRAELWLFVCVCVCVWVCGTTGVNRNYLSQRGSTALKSISCCLMLEWLKTLKYLNCNDTHIHIELFGTRLSVRYALQTERFVGLILLHLENKRALSVWNIMFSVPLRSTTQPKQRNRQHAVLPLAGVH